MAAPSLAALGHTITEKLTRDNFLVWKAQVLPHIRIAGLMGHLDGTTAEPVAVLIAETEVSGKKEVTSTPNPAHGVWVMQDQQVLAFLLASFSREVLLQVHDIPTATGVWTPILAMFASQSRARGIQLRTQLVNTKKGGLSATAYFAKMKGLADEMAAAGKRLDEDDLVSHILGGLDSDYSPYVAALSARTDQTIGLSELYAPTLGGGAAGLPEQHPLRLLRQPRLQGGNRPQPGRSSAGNSGGGGSRPEGGSGGPLKCQICKKDGHGAWSCAKRFDKSFNNNQKRYGGGDRHGGGGRQGAGARSVNTAATTSYGVDTN